MTFRRFVPLLAAALVVMAIYIPGCDELITENNTEIRFDSTLGQECNRCHNDAENRYLRPRGQWDNSQHASGELLRGAVDMSGQDKWVAQCGPQCHTHQGFLNYHENNGAVPTQISPAVISCFTCHAPHTGDFGFWSDTILRADSAFVLLVGDESYAHGRSNMCVFCHQAVDLPPQAGGTANIEWDFGPHFSPQANVLEGVSGWLFETTVAEDNPHIDVNSGCLGCHFGTGDGYEFGEHTFRLKDDATGQEHLTNCIACHTGSKDLDSLAHFRTYSDIPIMADSLKGLLTNWGFLDQNDPTGRTFVTRSTVEANLVRVLYNYLLYEYDGSRGAHNPPYIQQLLQASLDQLDSLPPVVMFDISDSTGCVPLTVDFTDQTGSMTEIISWKWTIDADSVFSTEANPTMTFTDLGDYSITLEVTDYQGNASYTSDQTIAVLGPQAAISVDTTSGYAPLTVNFTDSSECIDAGNNGFWAWEFTAGDTSSLPSPGAHVFDSVGTYTVILEVGNDYDTSSTSILIRALGPDAAFGANRRFGFSPTTVTFVDSSLPSGGIVSRLWDFGIGDDSTYHDTASDSIANWTYTRPGSYDVTLIVTSNGQGVDTLTLEDYVNIFPPVAVMEYDTSIGCAPLTVSFFNRSLDTLNLDSAMWVFGDGDTLIEYSPFGEAVTHAYDSAGVFTVELTAFSIIDDSVYTTKDREFNLINAIGPTADFHESPVNLCAQEAVTFGADSECDITTHRWYFGDDATSTESDPVHEYDTAGTYTVIHVAENEAGTDSVELDLEILGPAALFGANRTSGCGPLEVTFTAVSPCQVLTYDWDFGDGTEVIDYLHDTITHVYDTSGVYSVALTATGPAGTDQTITSSMISVGGVEAMFEADRTVACVDEVIIFRDTSSCAAETYEWDFGDGSTASGSSVSFSYAAAGQYDVRLIVTSTGGEVDTLKKLDYITIQEHSIDVTIATTDPGTVGKPHSFTYAPTGAGDSVYWDFGDPTSASNSSSQLLAFHTYDQPGEYTVTLVVWDVCGPAEDSFVLTIVEASGVVSSPPRTDGKK